jgi:hypothetical protein
MNRLGKTLCIFLALYFALVAIDSANGLSTCFFPAPVTKNQLDGLTCEWPQSSSSRIFALIVSVLGIVLSARALCGKRKARVSLAALIFAIGLLAIVNEAMGYFYFGYSPVSLERVLFVVGPLIIGFVLTYFSKSKHSPIAS